MTINAHGLRTAIRRFRDFQDVQAPATSETVEAFLESGQVPDVAPGLERMRFALGLEDDAARELYACTYNWDIPSTTAFVVGALIGLFLEDTTGERVLITPDAVRRAAAEIEPDRVEGEHMLSLCGLYVGMESRRRSAQEAGGSA